MKKILIVLLMGTCIPLFGMCGGEVPCCKDMPKQEYKAPGVSAISVLGQESPKNVIYLHEMNAPGLDESDVSFDILLTKLAWCYGAMVVDIYIDGCEPCERISRMITEINQPPMKDTGSLLLFVKVNAALCSKFANTYSVGSFPHILIFNEQELIGQALGVPPSTSTDSFLEYIKMSIKKARELRAASQAAQSGDQPIECAQHDEI
jgi:hypothetical protein